MAWLLDGLERMLCIVNLDTTAHAPACSIPGAAVAQPPECWQAAFSTVAGANAEPQTANVLAWTGTGWPIDSLEPGEARLYRAG